MYMKTDMDMIMNIKMDVKMGTSYMGHGCLCHVSVVNLTRAVA